MTTLFIPAPLGLVLIGFPLLGLPPCSMNLHSLFQFYWAWPSLSQLHLVARFAVTVFYRDLPCLLVISRVCDKQIVSKNLALLFSQFQHVFMIFFSKIINLVAHHNHIIFPWQDTLFSWVQYFFNFYCFPVEFFNGFCSLGLLLLLLYLSHPSLWLKIRHFSYFSCHFLSVFLQFFWIFYLHFCHCLCPLYIWFV